MLRASSPARLPWWPEPIPVRILVVTDGDLSFEPVPGGMSLSIALDALRTSPWWWVQYDVVRAHRNEDPSGIPAEYERFRFDDDVIDLDDFDQIWLFGKERDAVHPLGEGELEAIARFMDGGGGVFATGDHGDIGASLCGDIPRVDRMRRWRWSAELGAPPSATGPDRNDTLVAGSDGVYRFTHQSDDVPQHISPRYRPGWTALPWRKRSDPHPLLGRGDGAVTVLPDHMHEGACVVPHDPTESRLIGSYVTTYWPGDIMPEIVADGIVTAHHESDSRFGHVEGKTFGVVGAYDGHRVDVGRIAVDSSWHHWIDLNLEGFRASDKGSDHYAAIQLYFRNVAWWTARRSTIDAMFDVAMVGARWLQPLNELQQGEPISLLGYYGVKLMQKIASKALVDEWIRWRLPHEVREILIAQPAIAAMGPEPAPTRGFYAYREFALGGIIRELLAMPVRPGHRVEPGEIATRMERGLRNGFSALVAYERDAAHHVDLLVASLEPVFAEQRIFMAPAGAGT